MENLLTESALLHLCIRVRVVLLHKENDDTKVAEETKASSFLNSIWFLKNSDGVCKRISVRPKIHSVYCSIETDKNVCKIIKTKTKFKNLFYKQQQQQKPISNTHRKIEKKVII